MLVLVVVVLLLLLLELLVLQSVEQSPFLCIIHVL
jgi:hypothetical protein